MTLELISGIVVSRDEVTTLLPTPEDIMAKKETMPVRLADDAIQIAKKAASLKGMTLSDYASEALLAIANRDIDNFAKERVKASQKPKEGGSK
jgi:uncharacterized protein (DUF1778 family)